MIRSPIKQIKGKISVKFGPQVNFNIIKIESSPKVNLNYFFSINKIVTIQGLISKSINWTYCKFVGGKRGAIRYKQITSYPKSPRVIRCWILKKFIKIKFIDFYTKKKDYNFCLTIGGNTYHFG